MSIKQEHALLIEPQNELRFRGPFTRSPIASYMKLKNQTENQKVYFKIKTTVPKKYCVRPNSGLIKAQEECEIAVSLQPYVFNSKEKSKHKFMVQTYVVPEDEPDEDTHEIWKDIDPGKLVEKKLKCVFEHPVGAITTATTTNTSTSKTKTRISKSDSNSNDDKNKAADEVIKSSPKLVNDVEEKFLKASQEVNRLRVEENNLREENLFLKEDIMKWKHAAMGNDTHLTSMPGLSSHASNSLNMSTTNIIIIVAMAVIGYILGKLI